MGSFNRDEGWKGLIENHFTKTFESWKDVVSSTLSDTEIASPFGGTNEISAGKYFILWTKNRVYFPSNYGEMEWVESVPRNPTPNETEHLGDDHNV